MELNADDQKPLSNLTSRKKAGKKRNLVITKVADEQLDWLYYESRKRNDPKAYGQIVSEALGVYYTEYGRG